jgi:urease accessory protein
VGGYSYSQGLEYAVNAGHVVDVSSTRSWIMGLARHLLPRVDLPLLLRLSAALRADDLSGFARWNSLLLAMRETAELRLEDAAMGAALKRLLIRINNNPGEAQDYRHDEHAAAFFDRLPEKLTFAAALTVAGKLWNIEETELCDTCGWIWADNQVAAAIKLVPLGHSDGQRLLLEIADELPALTASAMTCPDEALGMSATGLSLCSAAHETMPARQFRS